MERSGGRAERRTAWGTRIVGAFALLAGVGRPRRRPARRGGCWYSCWYLSYIDPKSFMKFESCRPHQQRFHG
jgi:hypothetical protein